MDKGKEKCEMLKAIRAYVAEKYGVDYIPSECNHQGKCLGTCPKCDAELEYIQKQLEEKGINDIANDAKLSEIVEKYMSEPASDENIIDIKLEGDVAIPEEEGEINMPRLEGDVHWPRLEGSVHWPWLEGADSENSSQRPENSFFCPDETDDIDDLDDY